MDKVLKPEKFNQDANSPVTAKEWKFWYRTFNNYLDVIQTLGLPLDKLNVLLGHIDRSVYDYIEDCNTYEEAIQTLNNIYVKPTNEIFARHLLSSRRQKPSESINQFLQALRELFKDYNYKPVTAEVYKEEAIRDAFINGLESNLIRQRLLENRTLDLQNAYSQARSLDLAQKNAVAFIQQDSPTPTMSAAAREEKPSMEVTLAATKPRCWFCGNLHHPRNKCPARQVTCHKGSKIGHFAKLCHSGNSSTQSAAVVDAIHSMSIDKGPILSTIFSAATELGFKVSTNLFMKGHKLKALIDSGSTNRSFISHNVAKRFRLKQHRSSGSIRMAAGAQTTKIAGYCVVDFSLLGRDYRSINLNVIEDLCTDVILGTDFQEQHESVVIKYGGSKPTLTFCALMTINVKPPTLFANLSKDCKPIATKPWRFSKPDQQFIDSETQRLLEGGIIEPSLSPWRAQPLVVKEDGNHKKRMVIDYSQTVNKYTLLDAYPMSNIESTVNQLAQYKYFSTIDLKSAYHQIPLHPNDRPYTAFQSGGQLYQFTRMLFGVTNGTACFQRQMDEFLKKHCLQETYAYVDNLIICGTTKETHEINLQRFQKVVRLDNWTYNEEKCQFSTQTIDHLGYRISEGIIKPDPECLRVLTELPAPQNPKSLERMIEMFAYYAKWISRFSGKIKNLKSTTIFPLSGEALLSFQTLKTDLINASLTAISDDLMFVVETDASNNSVSAVLSQNNRPVAFHSRSLQGSELNYASVEKEALAIVDAVEKWRHFLIARHFILKTDQKSVRFMFDTQNRGKIRNEKILRWRINLASFSFDIQYRDGKENVAADTLTQTSCATLTDNKLLALHKSLCHPGVTRMIHFVRSRNLPHSVEEIRAMTANCQTCNRISTKLSQSNSAI